MVTPYSDHDLLNRASDARASFGVVCRDAGLAPLHDRSPVTVTLLAIAAAGWEFVLTLIAMRVVQARRIMRRHRLERLATTLPATGLVVQVSSLNELPPAGSGTRDVSVAG